MMNKMYDFQDKAELKRIYKLAFKLNEQLTGVALAQLHDVSKKTVESWLYEPKNSPNMGHLIQLHQALKECNAIIPCPLARLCGAWLNRRLDIDTGRDEFLLQDEHGRDIKRGRYVYDGNVVTKAQLQDMFSITEKQLNWKLAYNNILSGDDVTHINFKEGLGRTKKYTYLLDGKEVGRSELAEHFNLSIATVAKRLDDCGVQSGDDITGMELTKIQRFKKTGVARTEYNRIYKSLRKLSASDVRITVHDIMGKAAELGFEPGNYDVQIEEGGIVTLESVSIISRQAYYLEGKPTPVGEIANKAGVSATRVRGYLDAADIQLGETVVIADMQAHFEAQENAYKYIYRGELLTKTEIATRTGRKQTTFTLPFRQVEPGDDVTDLVDGMGRRNRDAKYIFNGIAMTRKQLSEHLGVDYKTIVNKVAYCDAQPGDDVTNLFAEYVP